MAEDLHDLGRLTDLNLAVAWVGIGGQSGEVGDSRGYPFIATGLPAAFVRGFYATDPVDDSDQLIADATT